MASRSPSPLSMDAMRVMLGLFCRARRLFPDDCFEQARHYDGMQYSADSALVLKKPPLVDCGAERLYNMVEFGVAECLDRQCMRSISFFIMDTRSGQVLEEMTMDCGQARGEYPSRTPNDALRDLTRKHRLLVQTLKPLPQKTTFAVRLTLIGAKMPYYSWIPPFFYSATADVKATKKLLNEECVSLRIGQFDSASHLCTMSIRSIQDPLPELSRSDARNRRQTDVVFDPEFTQIPDTDPESEMTGGVDVNMYQTIKTFVLSTSVPSLQRTHDAFKTVAMPTVRTYFSQLCQEGLLERRGRRFYGVKKAITVTRRASVDDKKTSFQNKRASTHPVFAQDVSKAELSQSYQQCWIPRTPIVWVSSQHPQFGASTANDRRGAERERLEQQVVSNRSLCVASAPIIQAKPQHKLSYHPKLGRPVLVASTSIVQTSALVHDLVQPSVI